jgi:hypothetical protein
MWWTSGNFLVARCIIFLFLVYCTKENLATLVNCAEWTKGNSLHKRPFMRWMWKRTKDSKTLKGPFIRWMWKCIMIKMLKNPFWNSCQDTSSYMHINVHMQQRPQAPPPSLGNFLWVFRVCICTHVPNLFNHLNVIPRHWMFRNKTWFSPTAFELLLLLPVTIFWHEKWSPKTQPGLRDIFVLERVCLRWSYKHFGLKQNRVKVCWSPP